MITILPLAWLLALAQLSAVMPDSLVGRGRTVGLDAFFNCESRREPDGSLRRYHYTWEDTASSGFSLLGTIIDGLGAVRSTVAASPTLENLAELDVYVIVDPDTPAEASDPHVITPAAADTIETWVRRGGVLLLMGNDRGNAEFEHLNALAARFGIRFNEDSRHRVAGRDFAAGTTEPLPPHPLFDGVRRIYLKEISSLTLVSPAEAILTEGGVALMAAARLGGGMVFAVGDPWLYNEYIDNRKLPGGYDNARAGENLFRWLLAAAGGTPR